MKNRKSIWDFCCGKDASRGFILAFMQPCHRTHLYSLSIIYGHIPVAIAMCVIFACLGGQSIYFFLVYWDNNDVYLSMGSPNRLVEGREAPLLFWARPSLLSIGFDRVALKTVYSSSIESRSCSIDSSTSSSIIYRYRCSTSSSKSRWSSRLVSLFR